MNPRSPLREKEPDTELDVVEGMQFDRGYLSPYFETNAENDGLRDGESLHSLSRKEALGPATSASVLEAVVQSGRPLLIIAEEVEGEALATLVVNKLRGGLKVAAVRLLASAIVARRCWKTWRS
jgi:chaperonin GroEL